MTELFPLCYQKSLESLQDLRELITVKNRAFVDQVIFDLNGLKDATKTIESLNTFDNVLKQMCLGVSMRIEEIMLDSLTLNNVYINYSFSSMDLTSWENIYKILPYIKEITTFFENNSSVTVDISSQYVVFKSDSIDLSLMSDVKKRRLTLDLLKLKCLLITEKGNIVLDLSHRNDYYLAFDVSEEFKFLVSGILNDYRYVFDKNETIFSADRYFSILIVGKYGKISSGSKAFLDSLKTHDYPSIFRIPLLFETIYLFIPSASKKITKNEISFLYEFTSPTNEGYTMMSRRGISGFLFDIFSLGS